MNTEKQLAQMLGDVFDAVEHLYGKDGLQAVTAHMLMANKARERNAEIDAIEEQLAARQ